MHINMLCVALCGVLFASAQVSPVFKLQEHLVDKKCDKQHRSFGASNSDVQHCAARCAAKPGCLFFSLRRDGWCIGCGVAPSVRYRRTDVYILLGPHSKGGQTLEFGRAGPVLPTADEHGGAPRGAPDSALRACVLSVSV